MEKTKTKTIYTTRSLVIMAMFTAVLCVSAYISIPLPNGTHFTALTIIITTIILTFPFQQAASIITVWMLLGIAGIPVFVGGIAGLGYITGPYGGYNVAFLLTSIFIPMICKSIYNRLYFSMIAILSAIIIDLTGTIWIMAVSKISFKAAFAVGFIPFILFDIIKAVLAAQLVPQLRIIINNFEN